MKKEKFYFWHCVIFFIILSLITIITFSGKWPSWYFFISGMVISVVVRGSGRWLQKKYRYKKVAKWLDPTREYRYYTIRSQNIKKLFLSELTRMIEAQQNNRPEDV